MPRTSAREGRRHSFADSPVPTQPRSRFDLSHGHHTAFSATPDASGLGGGIVPVFRDELLPGDTISLRPTMFARFTTMVVPPFSSIFIDFHLFAVPFRQVWSNAEEFFGAEPNGPGTRVDHTTPKADYTTAPAEESVYDFMGYMHSMNIASASQHPHNLYVRAYALIWNEWYRHPEMSAPATLDLGNGPDDPTDYKLLPRMKRRDYYTQALPTPQLGPEVTIDLGTSAPVVATSANNPSFDLGGNTDIKLQGGSGSTNDALWDTSIVGAGPFDAVWNTTGLETDLSSAVAPSVSSLRLAFAEQHLYEAFSRFGAARYTELLQGVWGVRPQDSRLFRPEFIGGTTVRIVANPVAASADSGAFDVGELAAYAVGMNSGGTMTYSSPEHQMLIGLASIRTQQVYDQGFDRELTRDTRFDFAWPQFTGVGEQPLESRELFSDGTASDLDVFGYVPRYDEYRRKHSYATGKMRTWATSDLSYYHLAQEWSTRPTLNEDFMKEDPPMDRITVFTTEPNVKFDAWFDYRAVRPLPLNGRPGLARL